MEIQPVKSFPISKVDAPVGIALVKKRLESFEVSALGYLSGRSSMLDMSIELKGTKLLLDLASEVRRQATIFVERILNIQA